MGQYLPILLPLIALIVGLVVVAGLWYWWTESQANEPEQDATSQPEQVSEPRPAAPDDQFGGALASIRSRISGLISSAGTFEVRRTEGGNVTIGHSEAIEVLRLYRDLSNGALVVQIGRQKYYSLDEIGDPQVRRRFLGNAEAMAQFAQLKKGTSPLIDWSSAPSTVNQARPPFHVDQSQGMPPPPPPPTSTSSGLVMPPPPPMLSSSKPAADTTNKGLLGLGGTGKKGEEPPPKSMADEIEELLQYRLTLDPAMSTRSIHIRSSSDGTIYVEVDGTTYDGIGDVKEDEVRAYLQRIVQEWEARK